MKKIEKKERQKQLQKIIKENPFLTDQELADKFGVSIQTIRLDRLELGIPEVRERTKNFAHTAYARLRSVTEGEVIGELINLELDRYAESVLETSEEMALEKSQIIRGHYIFAQANSLAVAVIDANQVLTGSANIKYHKPVYIGDRLRAKAVVKRKEKRKFFIRVDTYKREELVFCGDFVMFKE